MALAGGCRASYRIVQRPPARVAEFGRRNGLKIRWPYGPSRFESGRGHQLNQWVRRKSGREPAASVALMSAARHKKFGNRRRETTGLGRMKLGVYVALAALSLPFTALGAISQAAEDDFARFQFFANCEPMGLRTILGSEAEQIGLIESAVRANVESRLRSARLYDSNGVNQFVVAIDVAGAAFLVRLAYQKLVYDVSSNTIERGATWIGGGIGTHSGDSLFLVNGLSGFMDQFLVEYLRVNEEACEKR